ncbi:lipoprotein-releasing system ATP-binding protein [Blattabacterium sp. (Blatta orientalis) str. Tarazona]|uniref:ABC transporter ATP-binding protein n=1 Tax=Blattabacterium sp. (Blatta orientalis) TaxID=367806 RepID=UPI0002AD6222|nr:ABC transporter ATP-binding protein [Blattabacterium sp. (Blatta orientalis)]AGD98460.1 lipoprotein-releasing system ATP-binding protein [Blattabacterium sp. (Blatta orientalis) str. Tarazona]
MVQAENIYKSFGKKEILIGINIIVKKGNIVCILGESGAGKSTLLHILGTLEKPTFKKRKNCFKIDGENVLSLSEKKLSIIRNEKIGFVFQSPQLLPEFTALENVCLPRFIKIKDREHVKKKRKIIKKLHLSPYENSKPEELSGGQKQRLSVARALINDPKVIFADEPSGNLDLKNAKDLHDLFFSLREELEQTFLIVTHNLQLADMADEKLKIKNGKLNKIQ